FDFSMDRDTLHLSITDAMGHTVEAAVLATVLVGALRNARRADEANGLAAQVRQAELGLSAFADPGAFVTGQIARIELETGTAQIVNAGHPLPLRLRGGRVEPVALDTDPPFGSSPGHRYQVQQLPLEAGDRLVFMTDGVLERQARRVDVEQVIRDSAGQHPREAVQRIVSAVLGATGGALEDDASVLCLDWHGGPPRDRTTSAGANRSG
ncbi:MAG TPA: PP2C family protein-serine/threonine phosphatase, partial [Capillimicrobium sp.]